MDLVDIQKTADERKVALDQVGVCDLKYPITVLDRTSGQQQTIANVALSVALPPEVKGTHMSRFITVMNSYRGDITMTSIPKILNDLKTILEADAAQVTMTFPYFIEKTAPVSGHKGYLDCECTFYGESCAAGQKFRMVVKVQVASLCPCSKAISDYGAHNQRGIVEMTVELAQVEGKLAKVWIEELFEIAESSASAPLYPLLKRSDERHVTMQAYENPAFVEDIARNVAVQLRDDQRIASFEVKVTNFESIHAHNAFAVARSSKISS
ncbi:MAG: GTP cyclohydrolase I FolE2 [Candidatus Eremiobacteraeota bacterium]|nr:GTP cyclohydrolase I FolE2 [Candidatus Eremiobacteraeota bacterium]